MDNEASNLTKFSQEERGSTFPVNIGTTRYTTRCKNTECYQLVAFRSVKKCEYMIEE